jgi:glycogen debranching enzyme
MQDNAADPKAFPETTHYEDALSKLRIPYEEFVLYHAGLPGFPRHFFRDVVISALLFNDMKMLKDKLKFAARLQGKKVDPITGEQPGIIFHEYDLGLLNGVELAGREGKTTFYNGCDTTALFLIGHEVYFKKTGDKSLFESQRENIDLAVQYILAHLNEQTLFVEDPKFAGATAFALKVTYWKDSELKNRLNGEPVYPVIYPLAHIQNMAGLRSAGRLLGSKDLLGAASNMRKAIKLLINWKKDSLYVAVDKLGPIKGVSSDSLHALFYLEPKDIGGVTLRKMLEAASILETSFGYRTLSPTESHDVADSYHSTTIWTHEQAIIHKGARKHLKWAEENNFPRLAQLLKHICEVSSRVDMYLRAQPQSNPELFVVHGEKIEPGGCDPQLWAIAARSYFSRIL